MKEAMYGRLFFSLAVSVFVMYGVMFLNVDSYSHIYLSLTRLYMSLLMVSPMAIIMVMIMGKMYPNRKLNALICSVSVIVFAVALVFLRLQVFVSDDQYMRAMIPHHSSAILTSKHANIKDSAVKKLSEGIIESQEREIKEMQAMLKAH
ncbi:MAG: DUF305 domain-containing protein [Bacteroidetes bacterium]|nr:DUF305 domain-containing protein [Bacteroidota bacterium]